MKYDYLIVGNGLYGSTFAYHKNKQGAKCLVIDKEPLLGGTVHTTQMEGIDVHLHGGHIFHTSNKNIWNLMNSLCDMQIYQHEAKARHDGKLYTIPFNLNTINEIFGICDPQEAKKFIDSIKVKIENPQNLEEFAISQLGTEIYDRLIYGYTRKQWNKDPKDLPASIIQRLPIRFNFNNSYYNHKYQGIPADGYTLVIEKLLDGVDRRQIDFKEMGDWKTLANKLVYSGPIDEYFKHQFGPLEYRSLKWDHQVMDVEDYQGVSMLHETSLSRAYTRSIEHKHFNPFKPSKKTVVSFEYPVPYEVGKNKACYPVNTKENNDLFAKYKTLAKIEDDVLISGRLGLYVYLDMDQIMAIAIKDSNSF